MGGCSSTSKVEVSNEPEVDEMGRAKPRTGFHKDYVVGKRLGSGSYSTVRDAVCVRTKENVAVKIVTKMALTQEDLDALYVEVEVLRKLQHPNVVQLKAFYEDGERFYLVMENMRGGELLKQIERLTRYTEPDARRIVKILLETIKFCHDRGIVHRDLKPENILLTEDSPDAVIKLADFGFAHTFTVGQSELHTCLGTPGYVAPEIITKQKYGAAVDIWSMGVIFYILLCGYPPFLADTRTALFRCIVKGKYKFHDDAWGVVSQEAKDFISRMLVVDPAQRATSDELLRHPWLQSKSLATQNLMNSLANLKAFNARRRLRRTFHAVRAAKMLKRASIDMTRKQEEYAKLQAEIATMQGNSKYVQNVEDAEKEAEQDGVAVVARVGGYGLPDQPERHTDLQATASVSPRSHVPSHGQGAAGGAGGAGAGTGTTYIRVSSTQESTV